MISASILEQATQAIARKNWSLAAQYLQQITIDNPLETQAVLTIALRVFEQGDFRERWEIAKIFPKIGVSAIKPLLTILEDQTRELEQRWFVGRILGEFKETEVVQVLVNLLQTSEDDDLALIAATALANMGKPVITVLDDLLNNQNEPDTRLLATCALARIRSPEVIESLLRVVGDREANIRATALEALSSFHDHRVVPVLLNSLNDPASSVRKEAVIGLGIRSDLATEIDLFSYVEPRLSDISLEVCQQAAIALGRLGTSQAHLALLKVLKSGLMPLPVQFTIIQSLGWSETPTSLDCLQAALTIVSSDCVLEIIRILGRVKTANLRKRASQILLDFYHQETAEIKSPVLKQTLAYAWGQLGEPSAFGALKSLERDQNLGVRLHANATLKRLNYH